MSSKAAKEGKQRSKHTKMFLSIPIKRLHKRYSDRGFMRKAKKGKNEKFVPRRLDALVGKTDFAIISYYRSVIIGLVNYYQLSERLSDLYNFIYDLRRSAALTLAHAHKQKTAK